MGLWYDASSAMTVARARPLDRPWLTCMLGRPTPHSSLGYWPSAPGNCSDSRWQLNTKNRHTGESRYPANPCCSHVSQGAGSLGACFRRNDVFQTRKPDNSEHFRRRRPTCPSVLSRHCSEYHRSEYHRSKYHSRWYNHWGQATVRTRAGTAGPLINNRDDWRGTGPAMRRTGMQRPTFGVEQ